MKRLLLLVVLGAVPILMAPVLQVVTTAPTGSVAFGAFIRGATNQSCGGTSANCNLTSITTTSGDLGIVIVDLDATGTVSSITSSNCTTWALVDEAVRTSVFKKRVYWCLLNASGTDTVTITFGQNNAFPDSSYNEYAGPTSLDKHTNANGNNTSCAVGPTSATATANELIFASCSVDTSQTWSNGTTGYTNRPSSGSGFLSNQDKTVSSTGTQSFAVTITSHPWVAVIGTFQ